MDWCEVWERKGREETADLRSLDGFEDTSADPGQIVYGISEAIGLGVKTEALEVGCGAGMVAAHLDCGYGTATRGASRNSNHSSRQPLRTKCQPRRVVVGK